MRTVLVLGTPTEIFAAVFLARGQGLLPVTPVFPCPDLGEVAWTIGYGHGKLWISETAARTDGGKLAIRRFTDAFTLSMLRSPRPREDLWIYSLADVAGGNVA